MRIKTHNERAVLQVQFLNFNFQELLYLVPAIIVALTVHEVAHGFTAYLLGDKTAKLDGRLSFNPLRHIDPMGLLMLIIFRFGWAKPVMVNPYNLKNPKQDMALIAVAGPISNFLLAFITIIIFVFTRLTFGVNIFTNFIQILASINIVLGVFNLLPIPPLDGSKVFGFILPDSLYFRFTNFRYGMFILLGVILISNFTNINIIGSTIGPLVNAIYSAFLNVGLWIYSLFV